MMSVGHVLDHVPNHMLDHMIPGLVTTALHSSWFSGHLKKAQEFLWFS